MKKLEGRMSDVKRNRLITGERRDNGERKRQGRKQRKRRGE